MVVAPLRFVIMMDYRSCGDLVKAVMADQPSDYTYFMDMYRRV